MFPYTESIGIRREGGWDKVVEVVMREKKGGGGGGRRR